VLQCIERERKAGNEIIVEDMCYAFQETALKTLVDKTKKVIEEKHPAQIVLAGGVAANSRLRVLMQQLVDEIEGVEAVLPPLWCCTDNAAMIGAAGYQAYLRKEFGTLDLGAQPSKELCD